MILSDFTPRPHHRPQEPAIPLLFPPPLELVAVRRLPCHFPTLCNKRKHSAFTLSGESVRMGFAVFEDADAADQTVASKEAGPRPAVKIGVPNIGFAEISKPVSSSSPAPCRQTANKGIGKRPAVTPSTPFRLLYGSCAGAGGGVQLGEFSAGRREETGKPKSKFNPQG